MPTFTEAEQETARRLSQAQLIRNLMLLERRMSRAREFFVNFERQADEAQKEFYAIVLDPVDRDAVRDLIAARLQTKIDALLAAEGWDRDPEAARP